MGEKLGQNFLTDKKIVNKIIQAAKLNKNDSVLEIGPGKGILTEALAGRAGRVIAIEIDKALVAMLQKKFRNQKNIHVAEGDILKLNIQKLFPHPALSRRERGLGGKGYKIIANIPYYITSPIIRLFLENEMPPQEMILMVQKEVAERIISGPGDMSMLSVSVRYYADAEILFPVPKTAFDPVPEVDSAIIKITPFRSSPRTGRGCREAKGESNNFFRLVKIGFSAKRKTLANNLANGLHLPKEEVLKKIKTAGFLPTIRAQELSIEDWKKITSLFQNKLVVLSEAEGSKQIARRARNGN